MSTESKLETPIDQSAEGVVVHRVVMRVGDRVEYSEGQWGIVTKIEPHGYCFDLYEAVKIGTGWGSIKTHNKD
jgi:hypothetical protein